MGGGRSFLGGGHLPLPMLGETLEVRQVVSHRLTLCLRWGRGRQGKWDQSAFTVRVRVILLGIARRQGKVDRGKDMRMGMEAEAVMAAAAAWALIIDDKIY